MSQKQKVSVAIMTLLIVMLLSLLYSYFFKQDSGEIIRSEDALERRTAEDAGGISSNAVTVPATPDATVDAIIDDASLDEQTLQDESISEQDAVTASSADINNLTQTYDEDQL
jgi:hypothetical protein